MPGHKAKFLSFFQIIDQIYPKDRKFELAAAGGKTKGKKNVKKQQESGKKLSQKKKSLLK